MPGPLVLGAGRATRGQVERTETFASRSRALAFTAVVEEAGHDWPNNCARIVWTKGRGYVTSDVEADRGPSTFHDVAVNYFDYQTG